MSNTATNATDFVAQAKDLPVMPPIAAEVMKKAEDPDSDLKSMANLISRDASLAVRVLKIANSSFYSMPRKIESIQQAIARAQPVSRERSGRRAPPAGRVIAALSRLLSRPAAPAPRPKTAGSDQLENRLALEDRLAPDSDRLQALLRSAGPVFVVDLARRGDDQRPCVRNRLPSVVATHAVGEEDC